MLLVARLDTKAVKRPPKSGLSIIGEERNVSGHHLRLCAKVYRAWIASNGKLASKDL